MLCGPAYFFAVVCAFHLARTLGLVRLPRARPRVAGIRYVVVEIRLLVEGITSGGEIVPLSNTTGTIRVSGIWRGLLSCWDSGKRLSSICGSESKSSGVGRTRYFRLVVTTLTSSSLVLLLSSRSRSGRIGPPKRTLWRKWNVRTEAIAVRSIATRQCLCWIPRNFRRNSTCEESIIPRIPTTHGKTCTAQPWSV